MLRAILGSPLNLLLVAAPVSWALEFLAEGQVPLAPRQQVAEDLAEPRDQPDDAGGVAGARE